MPDITDPNVSMTQRLDANTLRVFRRSAFTGVTHSMELPITADQWDLYLSGTALIQNALPHLTGQQREFLLTGSTPEEWNAVFGSEEAA